MGNLKYIMISVEK